MGSTPILPAMSFITTLKKYLNDFRYVILFNLIFSLALYTVLERTWLDILGLPAYLYWKDVFLHFKPLIFTAAVPEYSIVENTFIDYEDINLQIINEQLGYLKEINYYLLNQFWLNNFLILKKFDFNKEYLNFIYVINTFEFIFIFIKHSYLWWYYSFWYPFVDFFYLWQESWNDFAPELPLRIFKHLALYKLSIKWLSARLTFENLSLDINEHIIFLVNLYNFFYLIFDIQYIINIFLVICFLRIYWIWDSTASRIVNWIEVRSANIDARHWASLEPYYGSGLNTNILTKFRIRDVNYSALGIFWLIVGIISIYINFGVYFLYFVMYGSVFWVFYCARSSIKLICLFFKIYTHPFFYRPYKFTHIFYQIAKFVKLIFTSVLAYIVFSYVNILYYNQATVEVHSLFNLLIVFLLLTFIINLLAKFFLDIAEFSFSHAILDSHEEYLYIFPKQTAYHTFKYFIKVWWEAIYKEKNFEERLNSTFVFEQLWTHKVISTFQMNWLLDNYAKAYYYFSPLQKFMSLGAIGKGYHLLQYYLYKTDLMLEFIHSSNKNLQKVLFYKILGFKHLIKYYKLPNFLTDNTIKLTPNSNIVQIQNKLKMYKKNFPISTQTTQDNYYYNTILFNKPTKLFLKKLQIKRPFNGMQKIKNWTMEKYLFWFHFITFWKKVFRKKKKKKTKTKKSLIPWTADFNFHYDFLKYISEYAYKNKYFLLSHLPYKTGLHPAVRFVYNKIYYYVQKQALQTKIYNQAHLLYFLELWDESSERLEHNKLEWYKKEEALLAKWLRRMVFSKKWKKENLTKAFQPYYYKELNLLFNQNPINLVQFFSNLETVTDGKFKIQHKVRKITISPEEWKLGEVKFKKRAQARHEFYWGLEYDYFRSYKYCYWTNLPSLVYDETNIDKLYINRFLRKNGCYNQINAHLYKKINKNLQKNNYLFYPKASYIISTGCTHKSALKFFYNYTFTKKIMTKLVSNFFIKNWLYLKSFKLLGSYQDFSAIINIVPKLYNIQTNKKLKPFSKISNKLTTFFQTTDRKNIYNYYHTYDRPTRIVLSNTIFSLQVELFHQIEYTFYADQRNKATIEIHEKNKEKLDPNLITPLDHLALATTRGFDILAEGMDGGLTAIVAAAIKYWDFNPYRETKPISQIVTSCHRNPLSKKKHELKQQPIRIHNKRIEKILEEFNQFTILKGK